MSAPVDPQNSALGSRIAAVETLGLPPTASGDDQLTADGLPNDPESIELIALLAPRQTEDELGRLAHFRILKKLGAGGMGMVLLAEDTGLLRLVALKIMLPRHAVSEQARERFLREARAAAKVQHDHVVTLHHVGEDRGIPFIAMEFLRGMPLNEFLKQNNAVPLTQAIRIGREIAEGLQAAHAHGLVHRDIKPANVWLEAPKSRVKILDFGLARDAADDVKLTSSGAILGTPAYMSPEQANGDAVDHRTDLFSLGIVLYELVAGRLPFTKKPMMALMYSVKHDPHPPIADSNPNAPAGLIALIDTLLAKEPENRPQSAGEVVEALAELEKRAMDPEVPYANSVLGSETDVTGSREAMGSRDAESSERSAGPASRTLPGDSPPLRKASASRLTKLIGRVGIVAGTVALLIAGFVLVRPFNRETPPITEPLVSHEATERGAPSPKQDDPILIQKPDIPPPPPIVKGDETSYDLGNGVKLDVIKIAAKGKSFLMGSPKDEPDRDTSEKDFDREEQHEVTFAHDFSMGKYEVMQEQYEAIMGTNPSRFKGLKYPVENVTWNDAQEFITKLNAKFKDQKVMFWLPSEAEWEYACRAGTTTAYNTGQTLTKEQAAVQGGDTKKVGSYAANAFGLHDMHGNVYEWCEDYYGPYSKAPVDGTAQTIKRASYRMLRGGSWGFGTRTCRSACRSYSLPGDRGRNNGFRVVAVSQNEATEATKVAPPPIVKGTETTYDLGNGVKLDVIKIPAKGKSFLMGSPKDEPGRNPTEKAFDAEEQHEVTFGHDFSMGKYEVTQEQYEAIMGINPARFKGPKKPVETVLWDDAQEFITKLNAKFKDQKVKFRLPSEAEWEYACRAGTTTAYNTGKTLTKEQAAFDFLDQSGPKVIGTYAANAFGLHDMHGNVYEWCEDYYGPYSKAPKDGMAQTVKQDSDHRVLRGGTWNIFSWYCRSACRDSGSPGVRFNGLGFRVVAVLP